MHALDLLLAYELAIQHDPLFQAARADYAADRENMLVGRAELLPHISLRYQNTPWSGAEVHKQAISGLSRNVGRNHSSYEASLTLKQPIFDAAAIASWRQGTAYSLMAYAKYRVAQEGLMLRLFRAYTDAMFAKDKIDLARAQCDVLNEQLQRNRYAFEKGDGTRTDIAETEARLRLAQISLLDAQDAADVAWRILMQMVGTPGRPQQDLASLRPDFIEQIAPGLRVRELEHWIEAALENNADLNVERQSINVARYELSRRHAKQLPTIYLFAQRGRYSSQTYSSFRQKGWIETIGITVNVPLYAGGGISASSRQASHQLRNARHTFDFRVNEVLLDVERQYRISASGAERINASFQLVRAAETALNGVTRGLTLGHYINQDALNAIQQLHAARLDLRRSVYDVLNARLMLKHRAGVLSADDLREMGQYFSPSDAREAISPG